MNPNTLVAYSPGNNTLITQMVKMKNRSGLKGAYFGQSVYQIKKENPNAQIMTLGRAIDEIEAVNDFEICTQPKSITRDEYYESLNILPPQDYKQREMWEYFHLMEFWTSDISNCFFRVRVAGKHYFFSCLNRVSRKDDLLVDCFDITNGINPNRGNQNG